MLLRKPVYYMALAAILILILSACSAVLPSASLSSSAPVNQPATPVLPQTGPAPQATNPTNSGISVMGTGQVSGTPDIARVTIGIETKGSDIKQAVADNNTNMAALIATLKAAGIADKDVQTANYNVSVENPSVTVEPAAGAKSSPSAITYHVSNQVSVTVRDLSKLSDILEKSVDSGANTIYGVSFDISDTSKLEDQARVQAVADAKARAEKLAQLEGVTLGSILQVSESNAMPGPLYAAAYGKGGGGVPIEGGSIQVTVTLQVTYAIK